jgi:predicted phage-related endonuclease
MQDVKTDREKYIGGSDISIIMNLSHFKDRYTLLLEKAGIKEIEQVDNVYVNYGNIMEPKIRQYVNVMYQRNFKEGKHIEDDIRIHTDGEDDDMILEIKTTSQIYNNVNEYGVYLVQLLFYMMNTNKKIGMLAVYERPQDFDEKFDSDKLHVYFINIEHYEVLCNEIKESVEQFRIDLNKIKANPFLTEEDLVNNSVVKIANEVIALENQLQAYKEIEKKHSEMKAKLKKAMQENNVKTWETPNGTKITLVEDTPDKEIDEDYYDEDSFMRDNLDLFQAYHNKLAEYKSTRKIIKKGRSGYVKITLGKNDEDE